MTVERVDVLVEEPSTEATLRFLLPKVLLGTPFEIYAHQGKRDLLSRLPARLNGYAAWMPRTWRVVVVVDRDDDDCVSLKAELEGMARKAGLGTRSCATGQPWRVVNRVAVEELESWFFGDWEAVRVAYPRVPPGIPSQARYRKPDAIAGGTWESLERVLQRAGYFEGGLRKVEAARAIGQHMEPSRNRSPSFRLLMKTMEELTGGGTLYRRTS